MLIVSEQQTFTKLRIAPGDCATFTDEQWLDFVTTLQGEREKVTTKAAKAKDPNAPTTKGRKTATLGTDWA